MAMQLKFFAIPALGDDDDAADAVNRFLGTHRIASLERHLVADGASSFWALCILYHPPTAARSLGARREKTDYRETLPAAEFAVYAKLRLLRKQLADRDGVPAYALFTNEQL